MLLLAASVYNLKKWLKFTAPKVIAKAVQMINPKHREGFGFIKNILRQLILSPKAAMKIFHLSPYLVKKLKIAAAYKLQSACKEILQMKIFDIKVAQQ